MFPSRVSYVSTNVLGEDILRLILYTPHPRSYGLYIDQRLAPLTRLSDLHKHALERYGGDLFKKFVCGRSRPSRVSSTPFKKNK